VIGAVVVAIGLLAIGWFVGVQPKLTEAAKAEIARLDAVEVNALNEIALVELKEQFQDLDELEEELAELQVAVPFELDAPGLYREIMASAAALGVSVTEIVIGEPRAYGAPLAAEAEAEPAEDDAAATAEEEPAPPVDAAPVAPPIVTDPRISGQNVVAVPTTITVTGPLSAVQAYLSAAQHGKRLYLVTAIDLTPSAGAGGADAPYTAVLDGYVYVLLDPVAQQEALAQSAG
jgi:hypothetical protein